MATSFVLRVPGEVLFGPGVAAERLPDLVAARGRRCLVFAGGSARRYAGLLSGLGGDVDVRGVTGEPTVDVVRSELRHAREFGPDVVVGVGGGSVIDVAKAVGALLGQDAPPETYLEVIGEGRAVEAPGVPVIAVPTTAGAGSEATANAVLAVPSHGVKVSVRGPAVLPAVALVDPALTLTCPPAVTAASGLDALTQCLEPLVSVFANPLSDGYAREGLRRAGRSLRRAHGAGEDLAARCDMSLAATFGGIALANAKLGAVHGIAGVLGGVLAAPHGAICARLLGPVVARNLTALHARRPDSPAVARYAEAAGLVLGRPAEPADLVTWIEETVRQLEVPRLTAMGWTLEKTTEVVAAAQRSSSMRGNPLPLTDAEVTTVLELAA